MGYYIRVLGKNLDNISLEELRQVSQPAVLHSEEEGDPWEQLMLSHHSGQKIAVIEKNPVVEGQLGADELQEFIEYVSDCRPESAATWLQQYLPSVKVIYACRLSTAPMWKMAGLPCIAFTTLCGSTSEVSLSPMARGFPMRTGSRFCGSLAPG